MRFIRFANIPDLKSIDRLADLEQNKNMKHRRGINLLPDEYSLAVTGRFATVEAIPEWYVLKGVCGRCGREGIVDRRHLERRFGKLALVQDLQPKLRCRNCGNQGQMNNWIITKASR